MTTGLIAAVILALASVVTVAQRSILEDQSRLRLKGLSDNVAQMAQESIKNHDQLMLLSYLLHLQKEHEEFVFASVSSSERTSTIGADRPGLIYWTGEAGVRGTASFEVSTVSATAGRARAENILVLKLGFDVTILNAAIANTLRSLTRMTAMIAAAFMILGWLGALTLSRRITSPLIKLATAVSAVKAGNLDVVVADSGSDEVGRLAARFNEMTSHLKELTQFREDLLHTLTHELNVPLGGLKGYIELWGDRKIPNEGPARDEILQTMTAAVLRMEQSLGNALGLFRFGALNAPKRSVWLNDLLKEACSLFTPEATAKKISISLPPTNVKAFVHADPEMLRQIISNLISNAVKYAPEGGKIQLTLESGKNDVLFKIEDNGSGIPAEDLPHLFTKFYRAGTEAGRPRVKGTGLGLNIAQKAAQALGGSITVASQPGLGTSFTVTLPKFAPLLEVK